jgi:oligopeptidase B
MLKRIESRPAPRADQRPVTAIWHGETVTDEFAWLRAPNWQEVMREPNLLDPAIRAYLDAENDYASAALAGSAKLQDTLFAEMKGRIKEDDSGVPAPDGPYAYFARYREGGQHAVICRMPRDGGEVEDLLDGDALAAGLGYFQFAGTDHSPDHKLLAWLADDSGSEFFTAHVRDLTAKRDTDDVVTETSGGVAWSEDSRGFYYVKLDEQHRPYQVMYHRLGDQAAADAIVLKSDDPSQFIALSTTQSRRYAEVMLHDHESSESFLIDLALPAPAEATLITPREPEMRYSVEHHPDFQGVSALIISTNADDAEDFKICWTPTATPGRAHWKELIPHRPGIYILSYAVLADWLIRLEREDGLPRIVARRISTGEEHAVSFDEEAYSLNMDPGYEFATDALRFTYSSMTTPSEVWDYDLATRKRTLRKRQDIPSGHDPARYVTRRVMATATDGETIPISLLYRKDLKLDGSAPALLYGYGAYGISIPAAFSANRLSLVDRGMVFAIAHIRGGTEKGWRWYREGKLTKKPNTFGDFIVAAEYLVTQRIAARERIVAQGGSAGGMLIGTVANLRPELFAGLIAEVPFVDVLNTMLDGTLPLTPPEWNEWGNPIIDVDAFKAIRSYSPYDNVESKSYPPMLVLAGLTDPRVTYWEPAKWVARLRQRKTDDNLLMLRTNMEAGHGGAAGRFGRLREIALSYSFALAAAGVENI